MSEETLNRLSENQPETDEKLTEEEWYKRHVTQFVPPRQPGESPLPRETASPGFAPNSEMPLYARSKSRLSNPEQHRRSQLYARFTYAAIILSFMGVCATAVVLTMQAESHKTGFRAIHVKKPISFIDYTYVDKKNASH